MGEWQQDENNPNHDAVKDVRPFQLVDDGPGMRGCWYYIKLRPGLEEFLQSVSKIYELHIYTMGTRAYAQNIANIVDPDRKIFGDRILSRDESGSLTAKNLQRLFPVDTKMVVIIDDRGDVWKWSDNLIKVSPYDFFIGIGDINSSFLPKKKDMNKGPKPVEKPTKPQVQADKEPAKQDVNGEKETSQNGEEAAGGSDKSKTEVSALEQLVTMGGGDNPVLLQEQANEQEETIAHQVEERPLLQKQKKLDAEDEAEESTATENGESSSEDSDSHRHQRHHLLEDSDTELNKLQDRLQMIHSIFFDEYDRKRSISLGGRVSALRGERIPPKDKATELRIVPDIKVIMPSLKRKILGGVVLVFSGVLPLGTDTLNADISLWARSFGATIAQKVNSRVTHLVAGRNRTAKVREATRYPSINIVTIQWLLDSLVNWTRQDEQSYLVPVHPEDRVEPVGSTGSSPPNPGEGRVDEHGILSSDDEESSTMSDEESDQSAPQINPDELQHVDEEILHSSGLNEYSPIGYDASEQAEVHDELKAFLGSDNDDSESDESDNPLPPETELGGDRKRKRGTTTTTTTTTESDESGAESDRSRESDSDAHGGAGEEGAAAADGLGSKLSRKIKKSRQRKTGLKEVSTVSSRRQSAEDLLPSSAPDSDMSVAADDANKANEEEVDDSDEYDAELEREMLAAFEDGNSEPDAMEAEPT